MALPQRWGWRVLYFPAGLEKQKLSEQYERVSVLSNQVLSMTGNFAWLAVTLLAFVTLLTGKH